MVSNLVCHVCLPCSVCCWLQRKSHQGQSRAPAAAPLRNQKRNEKTTPFGVNVTRSQVLCWPAQVAYKTQLSAALHCCKIAKSQRGAAMHRESRHDHEHAPTDRLQVVIVALSHSTVSAAHYGLAESAVLLRTIIVLAVMQISKEPKVGQHKQK